MVVFICVGTSRNCH